MTPVADPTFRVERALHRSGIHGVIGCDEVGRGALAGPLAVGVVWVDASVGRFPRGLRDSKMLAEAKREALAPLCRSWVAFHAVGLVSADDVDSLGVTASLGRAAALAVGELRRLGAPVDGSAVILDGKHDWFTPAVDADVQVTTRIKADRDCASVAAASVIAKTHRDGLMRSHDLELPGYGWASNKGYASREHIEAIERLGPSRLHRMSWLRSILVGDGPALFELDEAASTTVSPA